MDRRMIVASSMVRCAASRAASTMNSLTLRPWISAARFTIARASGLIRASTRAVRLDCWGMIKSLSLNVRHHPGQIKSIPNGSPEAVSCSRVGLPRHDDPFELIEGEREQEADQRDHEQPGIHLLDRKRAPSAPDQEAETTLGADHLGDGNQHQTDADTELEAGHDDRQRPRQRDGPERVPAARLEVPADIEIDAVDARAIDTR